MRKKKIEIAETLDEKDVRVVVRRIICNKLNIDETGLYSRSRKREYVIARQIYSPIMKEITKLSLSNIGAGINREHCDVIHYIKTYNDIISYDFKFLSIKCEITNIVKQKINV